MSVGTALMIALGVYIATRKPPAREYVATQLPIDYAPGVPQSPQESAPPGYMWAWDGRWYLERIDNIFGSY